MQKNF